MRDPYNTLGVPQTAQASFDHQLSGNVWEKFEGKRLQTTDATGEAMTGSRSNIIPFNLQVLESQPKDDENGIGSEQKDQYYFTFFKDNPDGASHRLHTTNAAGDSARHHLVEAQK
jgi:hypothetical protein